MKYDLFSLGVTRNKPQFCSLTMKFIMELIKGACCSIYAWLKFSPPSLSTHFSTSYGRNVLFIFTAHMTLELLDPELQTYLKNFVIMTVVSFINFITLCFKIIHYNVTFKNGTLYWPIQVKNVFRKLKFTL